MVKVSAFIKLRIIPTILWRKRWGVLTCFYSKYFWRIISQHYFSKFRSFLFWDCVSLFYFFVRSLKIICWKVSLYSSSRLSFWACITWRNYSSQRLSSISLHVNLLQLNILSNWVIWVSTLCFYLSLNHFKQEFLWTHAKLWIFPFFKS